WDGKPHVVERVGRPAINLSHLLIGIVGGLQPDKLSDAFKEGNDGMPPRFLYAWPETPPYRPLSDALSSEDNAEIADILERLIDLAYDPKHASRGRLALTDLARKEFEEFRRYAMTETTALDGREKEWMAKAQAHVLRLALTLRYLCWAINQQKTEPRDVRVRYVRAAVQLVRKYYWPHARASLRQIGLNQSQSNARKILRYLRARNLAGQE